MVCEDPFKKRIMQDTGYRMSQEICQRPFNWPCTLNGETLPISVYFLVQVELLVLLKAFFLNNGFVPQAVKSKRQDDDVCHSPADFGKFELTKDWAIKQDECFIFPKKRRMEGAGVDLSFLAPKERDSFVEVEDPGGYCFKINEVMVYGNDTVIVSDIGPLISSHGFEFPDGIKGLPDDKSALLASLELRRDELEA